MAKPDVLRSLPIRIAAAGAVLVLGTGGAAGCTEGSSPSHTSPRSAPTELFCSPDKQTVAFQPLGAVWPQDSVAVLLGESGIKKQTEAWEKTKQMVTHSLSPMYPSGTRFALHTTVGYETKTPEQAKRDADILAQMAREKLGMTTDCQPNDTYRDEADYNLGIHISAILEPIQAPTPHTSSTGPSIDPRV